MKIKVLVFPKDDNPYQKLLYEHMPFVETSYLPELTRSKSINNALFPLAVIFFRLKGYRIFHIHWSYGFSYPGNSYLSYMVTTISYYANLLLIRLIGYKIVWTVHNVLPHNRVTVNDLAARRFLALISSLKIIHSKHTLEMMKELGLNTKNITLIPHGNYVSSYDNTVTKSNARLKLEIMNKTFVYLFIGNIQKYKGVERLVEAYLSIKIKNSVLVIAGSCTDDVVDNAIRDKSRSNSILYLNQRIPDAEIQYFLNSADVVVYPFEKITTSGSVMLALSFGKPIIYPLLGALNDLPADIGFSYSNKSSTDLAKSLTRVYRQRSRLHQFGRNARLYAESQNWTSISNRTYLEYLSLIQ